MPVLYCSVNAGTMQNRLTCHCLCSCSFGVVMVVVPGWYRRHRREMAAGCGCINLCQHNSLCQCDTLRDTMERDHVITVTAHERGARPRITEKQVNTEQVHLALGTRDENRGAFFPSFLLL